MKSRLRAIIVDDEELARKIVREFLAPHEDIEILTECINGFEAVKAITELKPDLVFLDIQMPKLNGFEVLDLVEQRPVVVFVTAHDHFALKAFEVHAVDYLLKPFSKERFEEALKRAREQTSKKYQDRLSEVVSSARANVKPIERVLVREGFKVHIIPVDKIDYIEAQDDYISLRSDGKNFLKHQTLTELEATLEKSKFIRIHRSFIVNVERLARIEPYAKDSHIVILKDGSKLPVSRSKFDSLKQLL
ncbi:MAG: LytTR family transcriptional regulator DNA-binding domain-containing protein [Ignavibacteriales bacterium]|nr:LytTR family transcriptional regulator DNA-binding domain-containing protein [Ignavibacteriales bacterium]